MQHKKSSKRPLEAYQNEKNAKEMVIHVGGNPKLETFATYDSATNQTEEYAIKRVPNENEDKIDNFYSAIQEKFSNEFGCICLVLDNYVDNETRKKYIKIGENYGFKKVEIISVLKAELIDLIKNVPKMFERDDECLMFHVMETWISCFVWKKNDVFHYVCFDQIFSVDGDNKILSIDDLNELKEKIERKINATQMGLFDYENVFAKEIVESLFLEYRNFYYCNIKPWLTSSLIYARHLAGDPEFERYKSNETFGKTINVLLNGTNVVHLERYVALPHSTEQIIKTTSFKAPLQFHIYEFNDLVESYTTNVTTDPIKIVLTIDTNGIFWFKIFDPTDGTKVELTKENIDATYFRIPGKAYYFTSQLSGVGIDFGTSECCAAVNRKYRIETIALENTGARLLPTYVSFDESHVKCGEVVVNRMAEKSSYTVFDIKRILGMKKIKVDQMWPFEVTDTKENGIMIKVETIHGQKYFSPIEIAAEFFKYIKEKVNEFQGKDLTEAVITIPACYNETQKQSIIQASKLAGWKTVYLLPEPIAAAFAYCDEKALIIGLNLFIFDSGGGTLDISIVKTAPCMLHVLSSHGSLALGGRDFDNLLIDYFDKILIEKYGVEVMKLKQFKFLADCREIKHTLSYQLESILDVSNYILNSEASISITREKFEQLSLPLMQEIEKITVEAMEKANLKNEEINVVLYVGGGCKMPMIKNFLTKMFPKSTHCCSPNPDEMVAVGAALYACLLKSKYP